jgi:uncharacterized membrane protein
MKLYLYLRSIVWTAVFAALSVIAALITAFTVGNSYPAIPNTLALVAIALAALSPKRG